MKLPHESSRYSAEFESGFLFITDKATGSETMTRLNNTRGQNTTRGQFAASCKTHNFDKACEVFRKLAANV